MLFLSPFLSSGFMTGYFNWESTLSNDNDFVHTHTHTHTHIYIYIFKSELIKGDLTFNIAVEILSYPY